MSKKTYKATELLIAATLAYIHGKITQETFYKILADLYKPKEK